MTALSWPEFRHNVLKVLAEMSLPNCFILLPCEMCDVTPCLSSPALSGPNAGYFTDSGLLSRVPGLLLTLAAIYLGLGLLACLLITQPPAGWLESQVK